MNMARCLLFEKKLPKTFWAEAVNTAVFLLNRLPTRGLSSRLVVGAVDGNGSCQQVASEENQAVDRMISVKLELSTGLEAVDRISCAQQKQSTG